MEDTNGDITLATLVDLALGERRSLLYSTTTDAEYTIVGTHRSFLAILYQIPEKTLFMELFASLGQTDTAESVLAYNIHQGRDKVDPNLGDEVHLFLEVKP
jgi:hypothetical protein